MAEYAVSDELRRDAAPAMLTETAIPKGKLTVNDKLLRDLIRSRVKLNQIELRVFRRDVLPILRDVESELVQVLGSFDPDDVATKQRERELLREVRAMIENATGKIPPALEGAITDAAKREVRLVRSSMVKAVPEFEAVLGRGIPVEQLAQITQRTTKTLLEPFAATWGEDSLARVKRQLGASVSLGEDMREAARRVQSVIPATRSQALGIARTGIQRAANLAHDAYREQPETRELVKGVQAVATLDARTCVVCAGLDGKWWSYKRDPTADGLYSERPRYPLHPNCFPEGVVVQGPRAPGKSIRWTEGDLCIIRRSSGPDLPVTPNHPILTRRGWVAAGELKKGDELIDGPAAERMLLAVAVPENHNVPSRIEDSANSRRFARLRMPVSRPDFHGDGFDGEVDVQVFDRFLANEVNAAIREHSFDEAFGMGLGAIGSSLFTGNRSATSLLERVAASARPDVRQSRLMRPLCRTHAGPLQEFGFGSPTMGYPEASEPKRDDVARDSEELGARILRLTAEVHGSKVVEVNRIAFLGHVYNLQTVEGWYTANGAVVHNCRCILTDVLKSGDEIGLPGLDFDKGTRASMNGQVPEGLAFPDWLKSQPVGIQKSVLGPARWELWKSGQADFSDFSVAHRARTLAELGEVL